MKPLRRHIALSLLLGAGALHAGAELPDTGYALLEVNNPSSALTDFSLFVDLSLLPQDWWDAVDATDPTKGRAAKDAGEAELPCDWIVFDADTQTGWLRVLWTGTLASTGEQLLRVYPPQEANASVAAGDTYGQYAAYDEDWAAYWPLDGDTEDRTANGKDLTAFGSPSVGQGQSGEAYSFNGSNQYLEIDDPVVGTGYPYTLAVWFRSSTDSANQTLISLVDKDATGDYQFVGAYGGLDGDPIRYGSRVGLGSDWPADTTEGYSADNWHWAVAVGASSTDRRVYLDAGGEGQRTNSNEPPGRDRLSVGRMGDASPSTYFAGLIDEVQAHSVARSAAWIAQEYAQTSDPATFWGEPEWVPGDSGGGDVNLIPKILHYQRLRNR